VTAAQTTSDRKRHAVIVALALGLPLSAVFLWLSVRGADLDAVWATIGSARPAFLVATLACLAGMYWLQAMRWRRIAHAPLPTRSLFGMLIAALAVNNVVPGRIGDLLRANWLARAMGIPGGRAFATVVVDRGGDLVVLVGLLVGCTAFVTDAAWVDRLVIGAVVLAGMFALVLVGARVFVRRRRSAPRADTGLVRRVARDTLDGLAEPISRRDLAVILGLSVAAWIAWSVAAMLCARSIGIELTLFEAMFLAATVNLGVAIPSSPGFVGTYQWLIVSTLGLYGIGQDAALAFAVLYQACWYIPTTLAGGVLLARRMPFRVRVPAPAAPTVEQQAPTQA
jgi:glycosyltransferase 2 family protein